MKVSVDGVELFSLTPTQLKVFEYEIHKDVCQQELHAMLKGILEHKFTRCFDRMKKEWEPILVAEGKKTLPAAKEDFAQEVFKHPKYLDRAAKQKIKKDKELAKYNAARKKDKEEQEKSV